MDNRQLANRVWPEHEFTDAIEAPAERKLIKRIILLITGSILIMLLWSIFTHVEEISKSKGQVVPLGHRQVIQSRTGGTIASVDQEHQFVVIEIEQNFIDELIRSTTKEGYIPLLSLIIRRGDNQFVSKVRMKQLNQKDKLLIGEILIDWQQAPIEVGDQVFYQ